MDRIIKFRGKRKDSGEWVYGFYWEVNDENNVNKPCITVSIPGSDDFRNYEVIPETVGQFTGLKDKHGKELHENDIVLWDGRKAIIEWLPRMAGYYAMWKGEGVHFHDMQQIVPAHGGLRHIEIICNIHDNPEMLNPPADSPAPHTMTDPNVKQATEDQAAINAAEDQANDALGEPKENAEEGTTEG